MSKQEKYAVVVNENVTASVIKDVITFAMFAGLMYFNHAVLDGNGRHNVYYICFLVATW